MGAPRSRQPAGRPGGPIGRRQSRGRAVRTVTDQGGRARTGCCGSSTPRTSTSARATTTSASRRAAQRERQFAAFRATVDLALAEKVDLVPDRRRPVRLQRPAAPLGRARRRRARSASSRPGSGRSSSRARTTSTTARRSTAPTTSRRWPAARPDDDLVTVLTPDLPRGPPRRLRRRRPRPVFATKRAPHSPLRGPRRGDRRRRPRPGGSAWSTASIAIPGKTDRDEVVITTDEIAATGPRLPRARPLALGAAGQGRRRRRTPTPGRPRPVALDQDRAGKVLLVELERASTASAA